MIDLSLYGYCDDYKRQSESSANQGDLIPARIIEVQKEYYRAVCKYGTVNARLKGSFMYQSGQAADYSSTGDFVLIRYSPDGDSVIHKLLGRKSSFTRPDPSTCGKTEQIVAANFDYVFILQSLNQNFNLRRMERYLTAAWQSGGMPVILLTKADLCEDVPHFLALAESVAAGADIHAVSAVTLQGLDELSHYLQPGKTAVLLGSSGVGKSSLVNALAGSEKMEVGDIRQTDGRGRHTTTHRELICLSNGAMIIDTPGMRELGLWDASDGLDSAFAEIDELAALCRFSDCRHENEPGCAVMQAIDDGRLSPQRYENYLKLRKEARFAEKKESVRQRQQMKQSARLTGAKADPKSKRKFELD